MRNNRGTLKIAMGIGVSLFLIFAFFYFKNQLFSKQTVLTDDVMIEKITNMGKLELVKYSMKDVIEKKEVRTLLPDSRILFVAAGEVTGCIDLTKIKKEDVVSSADSVTVFLPAPEICYAKLDHQRSRVYDLSGVWLPSQRQEMVEDIYKIAEKKLMENAMAMNILGKTRENARTIFKPMLETISGKKVGVRFRN